MKRCPSCQKIYYDETLEFCMDDGSRLAAVDEKTGETLTAASIKPPFPSITGDRTVQFGSIPETQRAVEPGAAKTNLRFSEKKEMLKRNVSATTQKILNVSPIVLALAHNYWQWLYLFRTPVYDLTAFFTSYNFLVWIFLLFSGLTFGLFSLKYGNNKGFAITALVILAINLLLSIVPR
jgi:hypothetical protein